MKMALILAFFSWQIALSPRILLSGKVQVQNYLDPWSCLSGVLVSR